MKDPHPGISAPHSKNEINIVGSWILYIKVVKGYGVIVASLQALYIITYIVVYADPQIPNVAMSFKL